MSPPDEDDGGSGAHLFGGVAAAVVGFLVAWQLHGIGFALDDPAFLGIVVGTTVLTDVVAVFAARNAGSGHQRANLDRGPRR